MTDTEINIAIAEACGWRNITSNGMGILDGYFHGSYRPIPNYCTDLNAMHEAEKTLKEHAQRDAYADTLRRVAFTSGESVFWDCCHATARQRAEAFLRTIEKWKDA